TVLAAAGMTFNFSGLFGPPAISPDGSRIAMAADVGGQRMLFLRALRSTALQAIAGTEGASYPFWSPDGSQVAFFSGDRLKTVDATGGSVLEVFAVSEGRGGTWTRRGESVCGTRNTGLFL